MALYNKSKSLIHHVREGGVNSNRVDKLIRIPHGVARPRPFIHNNQHQKVPVQGPSSANVHGWFRKKPSAEVPVGLPLSSITLRVTVSAS